MGRGGGTDPDVFGDPPTVASRVQAAALPNSVFVTTATHELIAGLFVVEDRGTQSFKGIDRPVRLYRVIQPALVRKRVRRGLTPFVGREDETRLALSRWEWAREGSGQLTLLLT
jgi:class 3 adenylate cyclase